MNRPIVDYIGIGTNKSATTWIHQCLSEHPALCGSNPKETHFFGKESHQENLWFEKKFACKEGQKRGEFSPEYLEDRDSLRKIKEKAPHAKLIVCLRNPIERAHSAFEFNKERGAHTFQTIEDMISARGDSFLARGNYGTQLSFLFSLFERDQVFILFHDDIKGNEEKFIQSIYTFLEVDPSFIPPSAKKKVNKTSENMVRFVKMNQFIFSIRRTLHKNAFLRAVKRLLRALGLNWVVKKALSYNTRITTDLQKKDKTPLSDSTKKFLTNYYRDEIALLSQITNRDLSFWTN